MWVQAGSWPAETLFWSPTQQQIPSGTMMGWSFVFDKNVPALTLLVHVRIIDIFVPFILNINYCDMQRA